MQVWDVRMNKLLQHYQGMNYFLVYQSVEFEAGETYGRSLVELDMIVTEEKHTQLQERKNTQPRAHKSNPHTTLHN